MLLLLNSHHLPSKEEIQKDDYQKKSVFHQQRLDIYLILICTNIALLLHYYVIRRSERKLLLLAPYASLCFFFFFKDNISIIEHYNKHNKSWVSLKTSYNIFELLRPSDAIQANKEMTKDSNDHSHYEKSSQLPSENPTKDLTDLTRRRNGQRPKHQMFFLLVFLTIKQVVNKSDSVQGSKWQDRLEYVHIA